MIPRDRAAGFTLIEVLVAMFVLMLGATGMMTIFSQGQRLHGDARRMTRATAIAQDLMANIELWPYDDQSTAGGPLYNTETGNDATLGDPGAAFEGSNDPVADGLADHGEADLPAPYLGIQTAELGADYQRFWSVAMPTNPTTGAHDAMRIAVVVRWRAGAAWHRVVMLSVKPNPATVH